MKVLVTGAGGQLGYDVCRELSRREIEYLGTDSKQLDITDGRAVAQCFAAFQPNVVMHCAAYNKVDLAQTQRETCRRVNVLGTQHIAKQCGKHGAYMIYLSTDFVFDGEKPGYYETADRKHPLSVYGESKSLGEELTLENVGNSAVVRTSWLFGRNFHSNGNFVESILRAARGKQELAVVSDQIGSPTYAEDLAALLCQMANMQPTGVFHMTNEGACSRAELARAILRGSDIACRVKEVLSSEYPSAAKRPKNSCLSKSCLDDLGVPRLPTWQNALRRYLNERRKGER